MLLRDLQQLLRSIYGIDVDADVYDFLITDLAELKALENPAHARETEEKLLLQQLGEEVGVILFLDRRLLNRLSRLDPRERLSGHNLADFCTVLEGISHFNYVAWNAAADKQVTLLELELQAEIDKYISARLLLENQRDSSLTSSLFQQLFDDPGFQPDLEPEELSRYRNATNFAGQYCYTLETRFPSSRFDTVMMQELREFYRLSQPGKVSHIHTTYFA